MNPGDRELRLRERIDVVTDERDKARDEVKRLRLRLRRFQYALWSRDLWRHRALDKWKGKP